MTAFTQQFQHGGQWVRLPHNPGARFYPEPRRINCCLRIPVQIDQLLHHLQMALSLHIATHHAKTGKRFTLTRDKARDDGVHWPTTRPDTIAMLRVEREAAATVMQGD